MKHGLPPATERVASEFGVEPRVEALTLGRTWELSYRGRTAEEVERVFGSLGLTRGFWRL